MKKVIELTPVEIQSGLTRVKWAEALIRQLPEDHDGRNSWLLNYSAIYEFDEAPWNGEGLPPVGLEIEVLWSSQCGTYVRGKVVAHDDGRAVFRFLDGERSGEYQAEMVSTYNDGQFTNFRPIRTAEQIAAEERKAREAELATVIKVSGWESPEILAAYLESHGYRKVEQ